jgi:phenylalanyl-tRNA synthetase alpha chain
MLEKIKEIKAAIDAFVIDSPAKLEEFRISYLAKKGVITDLMTGLKDVVQEERKSIGLALNDLKTKAWEKFEQQQAGLVESTVETDVPDMNLPVQVFPLGSRHPLSIVRQEIIEIFEQMGFAMSDGPEIEDDWHNFSALNFPQNHPARDMQDTFFISKNPDVLLRTHTSTVQVRLMEKQKPPIRAIMPGRVYRNEAISARAHCLFHQIEGLYIDRNVGFKDLKQTLYHFVKEMFGKDQKIRFRPSFFPFTEPSAEIDISCLICHGAGCNICKHTGWVEIGGSGMVDPNVLTANNIDPEEFTGFAFGMGIERITMLRYGIKDLRLFTENDVRFVSQFSSLS